jgi:2-alkyl-3-oxoalkanoate reductase
MKVLVTGGGGFLGKAIVTRLCARGDAVRSLSRGDYPELTKLGVECVRGDVADATTLLRAADGCQVIFHVAAKAGVWGRYEEYHRANVVGTENVLAACRAHGIQQLIYTSSPSVVFNGRDEAGSNETAPYPKTYLTHYPRTKAMAEQAVLRANGERLANGSVLATIALRPHLIWGPGDNHLVPRLIERARQGKLRRIGSGNNLVDTVYVDNAADAHLLADDKLATDSSVAGRAYFITNGEPVPLWDLIDRMLACADLPPVRKRVSARTAYVAGAILEAAYRLTGRTGEPPMTRFVARQLSTAHWFDITAARRDLGYEPRITLDEGLKRLAAWLRTGSVTTN